MLAFFISGKRRLLFQASEMLDRKLKVKVNFENSMIVSIIYSTKVALIEEINSNEFACELNKLMSLIMLLIAKTNLNLEVYFRQTS